MTMNNPLLLLAFIALMVGYIVMHIMLRTEQEKRAAMDRELKRLILTANKSDKEDNGYDGLH